MSDDLVSLQMLVIAAPPEAELWRQGAARASVPVEFLAPDPASGAEKLARGSIDICVIDAGVADAYKATVLQVAGAAKPRPLVFVSAQRGTERFEGADGMLVKPTNVSEASKLAEICIRAKIPTRVLIVDDSSTMRSIVRKILTASRFALDLHESSEGLAALNQLRSGNFGLVFLDYNMPGFNGIETLSEIKREIPGVAVVMMTSTLDNSVAGRAHAAGALAFLKKPFFPADIDAILERYFGLAVAS